MGGLFVAILVFLLISDMASGGRVLRGVTSATAGSVREASKRKTAQMESQLAGKKGKDLAIAKAQLDRRKMRKALRSGLRSGAASGFRAGWKRGQGGFTRNVDRVASAPATVREAIARMQARLDEINERLSDRFLVPEFFSPDPVPATGPDLDADAHDSRPRPQPAPGDQGIPQQPAVAATAGARSKPASAGPSADEPETPSPDQVTKPTGVDLAGDPIEPRWSDPNRWGGPIPAAAHRQRCRGCGGLMVAKNDAHFDADSGAMVSTVCPNCRNQSHYSWAWDAPESDDPDFYPPEDDEDEDAAWWRAEPETSPAPSGGQAKYGPAAPGQPSPTAEPTDWPSLFQAAIYGTPDPRAGTTRPDNTTLNKEATSK